MSGFIGPSFFLLQTCGSGISKQFLKAVLGGTWTKGGICASKSAFNISSASPRITKIEVLQCSEDGNGQNIRMDLLNKNKTTKRMDPLELREIDASGRSRPNGENA